MAVNFIATSCKHSINNITRKHRQSYRHADPRRQQHTAVAARVSRH